MDSRSADEATRMLRVHHVSWIIVGLCILLLLFVTLALSASLQKSPTADESFHILSGYSYLKWNDYRVNPEHPPLVKLLAALPLLAVEINDAPLTTEQRDKVQENGRYGWLLANRWLFSSNNADALFFWARLPLLILAVILGLLVFSWARELYGLAAGFFALSMYVLDPNILAHAPIIHTDLPFALTLFGGTYFLWRTLKDVTWFNCLTTAVLFSLSTVTKFSFVAILPIWVMLMLGRVISPASIQLRLFSTLPVCRLRYKMGMLAIFLLSIILLGYLTVWASYGFSYRAFAGQGAPLGIGGGVEPKRWFLPLIDVNARHHVFPEAWVSGLVYALSSFNRTAYLLGNISGEGFWLFFPIAFALKTPLPLILLLFVSLVLLATQPKLPPDSKFIWMPVLLFLSAAVYSRMNIGLRHILPIYPFVFVWLGGTLGTIWGTRSLIRKGAASLLIGWMLWSTLKAFPDYLAFFNETISADGRYKILVDSNLDWGQDLTGLKRWMDANAVANIELAYFGTADPAYYGIASIHKPGTWTTVLSVPTMPDDHRTPRHIAISATHLVGLYFWPSNPYQKYLAMTPAAVIGGSIYIFELTR